MWRAARRAPAARQPSCQQAAPWRARTARPSQEGGHAVAMMLMAGRGLITGPHPVRVAFRPSAARVLPIMQRRLVGGVAGAAAAAGAAAPAAGSRFKLGHDGPRQKYAFQV